MTITTARMTVNNIQPLIITCAVLATSIDANALVSPTPAGTNKAYAKTIIQPVRKTSTVTTDAAGATMLAPNAITRAGPTAPEASPRSPVPPAFIPQPPPTLHTRS
jgi:hypothetical protein